jgi:hypothetical protein
MSMYERWGMNRRWMVRMIEIRLALAGQPDGVSCVLRAVFLFVTYFAQCGSTIDVLRYSIRGSCLTWRFLFKNKFISGPSALDLHSGFCGTPLRCLIVHCYSQTLFKCLPVTSASIWCDWRCDNFTICTPQCGPFTLLRQTAHRQPRQRKKKRLVDS